MASITVDIQAKVVGYEASLKAMKEAFSKINPGSDIGKSLDKAIKYAEGQLKNLSKNLTPKATSDTQLDAIVEKTNRAGEAIQEVTSLMQKIRIEDIDFSKFDNDIGKLMGSLSSLEEELNTRVSDGLRNAIAGSAELSEAFKKFNIDTKDKTSSQIFDEISEKAQQATKDTEEAEKALKLAQETLNNRQTKLNQLESNPIYNKDTLKQELNEITSEYLKTFDSMKETIRGNLNNLLGGDETKTNKMMEVFMQGLSPQTLKNHLMQLKDSLQKELKDGNSAKEIYTALLGDIGNAGNAQAIATKLLTDLNKILPTIKEGFQGKFQEILSSLTNKEAGNISVLMDEGDLEGALNVMLKAIERAYSTAVGEVKKGKQAVADAIKERDVAQENYNNASSTQQDINGIVETLTKQLNVVQEDNKNLQNQIVELRNQIQERKSSITSKIKQEAGENNLNVEKWKIGADEAKKYQAEMDRVIAKEKLVGKIEGVVQRWFSIYAAVRMVGNAIRSVISTVQELDKTITEIAIVTDMTQNELWGQMKSYTDMARQYAASISGVYQVSQLYYQQGLQTADVMALTEETLKMARISGLGYAEATDYMTNAVRSFKMEMTDAQRVVDVYSEIAASSATSTSELASAMSKTASSAEAVGSSFENTTAMMAVMIEATRESAENIGSAMKSIISRYGEMTTDPSKLTDSEGQEMSLNKVDKALQSVGITIQDTNHQFRNFDEVITELAGKWDTIDTNTQRYIATVMAGNRQQSRFLALVSNGERLTELSEKAANSEDTATLQVLKTMDSIEAKTQQFKTSLQSLYTDTGIENLYKGFLDIANNIVKSFTEMARLGKAPVLAVVNIGTAFASLANVVTNVFALMKTRLSITMDEIKAKMAASAAEGVTTRLLLTHSEMEQIAEAWANNAQTYELNEQKLNEIKARGVAERAAMENSAAMSTGSKWDNTKALMSKHKMAISTGANLAGLALSLGGANISNPFMSGLLQSVGSGAQGVGLGMSLGGPVGAVIGGVLGSITGAISNWTKMFPSLVQQIESAQKEVIDKNNEYLKKNAETKDLNIEIQNLKKLESARYDSIEAEEAYNEAANKIAETYPNLIDSIDEVGNVTINLNAAEQELANSRQAGLKAAQEAAIAEYKAAKLNEKSVEKDRAVDINTELSKTSSALYMALNPEQEILETYFNYSRLTGDNDNFILNDDEFYSKMLSIFSSSINSTDFLGKLISEGLVYEDSFDDETTVNAIEAFYNFKESFDYSLLQYISGLTDKLQDVPDSFEGFINSWQEESGLTEDMFEDQDLIQDALDILANSSDNTLKTIASIILSTSQDLGIIDKDLLEAQQQTADSISSGVLKEINAIHSSKDNSFLKEIEGISKIMTQQGVEAYTGTSDEDYENYINNELPELIKIWDKEWNEYWEGLNSGEKERFNNLIKNYSQYSELQARGNFDDLGIEDVDAVVNSLYKDAYNYDKFSARMASKAEEIENQLGNVIEKGEEKFYQSLGASELLGVNNIYDKINNLIRSESLSQTDGQELYNQFETIGKEISDLDEEIREPAEKILYNWEDFSINGILTLANSLKELGINDTIIAQTKQLISKVPVNLEAEAQTLLTSTATDMEDFGKALTNAYKGMDLKAATEMASKLDLNAAKDFEFKDGKYFFNNPEKIKEGYLKYSDEYFSYLDEEFNAQEQQLASQIQSFSAYGEWDKVIETKDKLTQLAASHEETKQAFINYRDYQVNSILIQNGFIRDFLTSILGEEGDIEGELTKIRAKNFEELAPELTPYISELWNYIQNSSKSVFDKAISTLQNGSTEVVKADASNKELLQTLGTQIQDTDYYVLELQKSNIENLQNQINQAVRNGSLTKKEANSLLASIHTAQYEDNIYEVLSESISNYEKLNYEAAQSLGDTLNLSVDELLKSGEGLISLPPYLTELSDGTFKVNLARISMLLDSSLEELGTEKYNELKAILEKNINEKSDTTILSNIIQNRDKLSEEDIESLANMLNTTYNEVVKMLHQNSDGTYTASLSMLQTKIATGQVQVSEAVMDLFAEEIDEIISSITGLSGSQSKGFTDLKSMQEYVSALREKGVTIEGQQVSLQNMFEYNNSLQAYQLSEAGIIAHLQGMKSELDTLAIHQKAAALTGNEDKVQEIGEQLEVGYQFINDSLKQFASNINAEEVISAIGTNQISLARTNFRKAVEDYNAVLMAMAKTGEEVTKFDAEAMLTNLQSGGIAAVETLSQLAKMQGKKIAAEQAEAAYRASISNYVEAIDTVIAQPGEIVDSVTARIINQSGGHATMLADSGTAVVEKAANLYEAYSNLLRKMTETGEATLADLNKVTGLALDNKDGQQVAIDALGDAANLTYSRLGEIFTSAGKLMTKELIQDWTDKKLIKSLGGNKIQITDFTKFADLMGFDTGSPEYISAFKTYNDSLIEMNRQAERNILEEATSVADAKGGDWINLTQLYDKVFEPLKQQVEFTKPSGAVITAFDRVNQSLSKYGGFIEDGILKLEPSANIPAIMQEIARAAAESGGLLSNELAELADAVADTIKGYADLISGAISGSLSNTQAEQLQDWATANGIGDLNFTQTADGLKVAKEQAFELVNALKQVDSMQGKLTFDNLVDSLSADKGGKFENISKTTAEIAKTQRDIQSISDEIAAIEQKSIATQGQMNQSDKEKISNLRQQKSELQNQLSLYQQIQQRQSIDPSQYNFMDRELPEVMQGPINYWNSIGQAFSAMNEAGQTGRMAINDFYNIVTEMENLANTSGQAFNLAGYQIGGEASQAAQLIQDGLNSLTNIDGKGVKVNLAGLGIDFASGADDAKQGFAEGIHSLAQSQIDMLDAAIKVLEVVVAMEELGSVDVDQSGTLDLGEIFTLDTSGIPTDWNETYTDAVEQLLEKAKKDKELEEALNSVKINGRSMMEFLKDTQKTFDEASKEWGSLRLSAQAYQQVMSAFYQAMSQGDYDLDTIQDSVWQVLDQFMPDGTTIDLPDRTLVISGGYRTMINWESENTQEALKNFEGDLENQKTEVIASVDRYTSGGGKPIDALITLAVNGKIKIINKDKGQGFDIEGPNGEKIDPTSKEGQKIIADAALENAGIEDGQVVETDAGAIEARGTVTVGDKVINVKSDGEGKVAYHSDTLNQNFASLEDLLHAEYEKYTEEQASQNSEVMSYDAWLHSEYNVTVQTDTKFINADGSEADPTTDPQFQQDLADFFSQSHDTVQDYLNNSKNWIDNKNGTYTLELPLGEKITVSAPDIESAADKVEAETKTTIMPIVNSVKTGITEAFTDTQTGVSTAITSAIQSALGINTGSDTGDKGSQNKITIPEVTLAPTGLKIDLSSAGEPTLSSGEEELQDISIPEITLKPETINVDTASFNAEPVAKEIADAIQEALKEKTITPNIEAGISEVDGLTIDTSSITNGFADAINAVTSKVKDISKEADKITADNVKEITTAENQIGHQHVTEIGAAEASISSSHIGAVRDAANEISSQPAIDAKNAINQIAPPSSITTTFRANLSKAKGTVGNNIALAGGQNTLMGELGPELVVSHGRYFLVGQNGAEFVNLDKDAIVFNHLQTRKLMEQGAIGSYGRPITNDRNAVSMAGGKQPKKLDEVVSNVPPNPPPGVQQPQKIAGITMNPTWWNLDLKNKRQLSSGGNAPLSFAKGTGPAMASASAALEALKRLRAMWQSLLGAGLDDLGALGGSGGGGGGGGGGKTDEEIKSILDKVEKWYNLLQKIEGTQRRINILQKQYTLLGEGQAHTHQRLDNLQKQYAERQKSIQDRAKLIAGYEEDLAAEQAKIEDKKSGYSAFFDFDEDGNLQLADEENFSEWIKKHGSKAARQGTIEVEQRQTLTGKEAKKINKRNKALNEKTEISEDEFKSLDLTDEEKKNFKKIEKDGKVIYQRQKELKTDYVGGDSLGTRKKPIKVPTTGLELMNLLQTKDEYGNNIYDSEAQFKMLKELGFEDMMSTLEDGTKLDLTTSEGRAQAVENLIAKVNGEKEAYEQLTQQIQEQTEAKYDDEIAIQEINDQIKELATPVAGVTEGLDKWHNRLREITKLQNTLNNLTKTNNLLQKDGIANGAETYQNLQLQLDNLTEQVSKNASLAAARRKEAKSIYNKSGLKNFLERDETGDVSYRAFDTDYLTSINQVKPEPIQVIAESQAYIPPQEASQKMTGIETAIEESFGAEMLEGFKDRMAGHEIKYGEAIPEVDTAKIKFTRSTDLVRNEEGYLLDTEGQYVDSKGQLHNKKGEVIQDGHFGQLAVKEHKENRGTFKINKGENMADVLERLTKQDANGKTAYTAEEQFQILTSMGLGDMMQYDESGNRIYDDLASITPEQMKQAVENGIARIQSTVDDINEQVDAAEQLDQENLELRAQAQEIVQSIIDNQMELENKVLQAIEDSRQTAIDNAQKERDAYEEATNNLIDGLSSQLQNERDMYSQQQDQDEVTRLQRQIAILQRSGGSGSQIQSLQDQLASKQQDMYFDQRQAQIDQIKEASDAQLEKMDHQIEIMTETLQYEKENGLLWADVAEVMKGTSSEIAAFIAGNTKEYASYSALALQQQQTRDLESAQMYTEGRDADTPFNAATALEDTYKKLAEAARIAAEAKEAADTNSTNEQNNADENSENEVNAENAVEDAIEAGLGEEGAIAKKIAETQKQIAEQAEADRLAKEQEKIKEEEKETQRINDEAKKEAEKEGKHQEEITAQQTLEKELHTATKTEVTGVKDSVVSSEKSIVTALKKKRTLSGSASTNNSTTKGNTNPSFSISLTQYKTGGLNTKPGLAWLDGTPTKPEYVLNADQTAMLKDALFMSSAVSSALSAMSAMPSSVSSIYDSIREETIEIGSVSVNVNVPSVSSDYDSRRIGEIAMEEMMQIARKHGARGLSRR